MRREGREPLPDHAAGTLGVPLEGTRRVGGLLGVAGRLTGTVSPFRAEKGTSLAMEFSRQEYWSGLPWPSPGDLPDLGIEAASLMSPAQMDS